jgi:hypothetical protein
MTELGGPNAGPEAALIAEALCLAGGERNNLLSRDRAVGFYERFPNFRNPGFASTHSATRMGLRAMGRRAEGGAPVRRNGVHLALAGRTFSRFEISFDLQPGH